MKKTIVAYVCFLVSISIVEQRMSANGFLKDYGIKEYLSLLPQIDNNQQTKGAGTDFDVTEITLKLKSTVVKDQIVVLSAQVLQPDLSVVIYNALKQKGLEWDKNPAQEISVGIAVPGNDIDYIKTNLQHSKPLKFLKTS